MQYRRMRTLIIVFVFFSAGLLGACASTPEAKNIAYSCDRGTNFTVSYTKKGFTTTRGGRNHSHRYEERNVAANITLTDGSTISLPAQKVDSGFMFSNGRYTFNGEGNKTSWAVGRMLAENCQTTP